MTPGQLIDVLQGVKAGRRWQYRFSHGEWETPKNQGVKALLSMAVQHPCECRLEPLPDEIMFNGVMISAPLRVAPADGTEYWFAVADGDEFFGSGEWAGDKFDQYVLAHGLLHLTPEAAAKHGRAMCIPVHRSIASI